VTDTAAGARAPSSGEVAQHDAAGARPEDDAVRSWPGAAPAARLWPALLLSLTAVTGLLALLLVRNPRYFYVDDRQAETVPKAVDIGRLVRAGEWPWLSDTVLNGGAYALEYLNGVHNPANVALYALMASFDDLRLASFAYVVAHCLLLTASAAWLGHVLGLSTAWITAFAVSVGFQQYTVVWNATAWSQGLVSLSWAVLAVAAAAAFTQRPRRRSGWLLLVGVFGTLTSGWPHAVLVLGLFLLVLLLARLHARADLRTTGWLAAWAAGGAVASLVAVYPLLRAFEVASRESATGNDANFNVAPLDGLLHFADPSHYAFFVNFEGYGLQELPHFYVAWFALPVLVLAARRPVPGSVRPLLVTASVLLAVSVLGSLGPERLSVLRYPTRFVQYAGLFLLIVVALLVAHGGFRFSRTRLRVLLALVAVLAVHSAQVDPEGTVRALVAGAAVAGLGTLLWRWARSSRADTVPAGPLVAVATVLVLAALAVGHPEGRGRDHGIPARLDALVPVGAQDRTLFYGVYASPGTPDSWYREYRPATTPALWGDRAVNGYSSLGNRHLRTFLDIDDQGNLQPGAAQRFAGRDPGTGVAWLDLLRVDQVVALRGPWDEELLDELDPAVWRRTVQQHTSVYRREAPALPGWVSWTSPGTGVQEGSCPRRAQRECLVVQAPDGGRLLLARLWLPGWSAELDGEPVDVRRGAEAFLEVVLPPGADGELELVYRSPGLVPLTLLAVGVLLALAAASTRWHPGAEPLRPGAPAS
jgi:hypothetical protein